MANAKRVAVLLGGAALAGVALNMTVRVGRTLFGKRKVVGTQEALVGQMCSITTLEVSETFGQASVNDGGAGLILSVRCPSGNVLTRGAAARIVYYNAHAGTYDVEPI